MPRRNRPHLEASWSNRLYAFRHFAEFEGRTQTQKHIRPLHKYVTSRLVIEGGFHPDDLVPRPPFTVRRSGTESLLVYEPKTATDNEATVLGGLKTKSVDIVATKEGIGPVLAVSCKGMTGAVRNLTNRLEETIGECTNIHISYPTLVFGYLFVIRANQESKGVKTNDVAISACGEPVEAIVRFHAALSEMTGRLGIRDDVSRYEAVSMALIDMQPDRIGQLMTSFPASGKPTNFESFFTTMYRRYDERYVVSAPTLARTTRRLTWSPNSPAFESEEFSTLDYSVRVGA